MGFVVVSYNKSVIIQGCSLNIIMSHSFSVIHIFLVVVHRICN